MFTKILDNNSLTKLKYKNKSSNLSFESKLKPAESYDNNIINSYNIYLLRKIRNLLFLNSKVINKIFQKPYLLNTLQSIIKVLIQNFTFPFFIKEQLEVFHYNNFSGKFDLSNDILKSSLNILHYILMGNPSVLNLFSKLIIKHKEKDTAPDNKDIKGINPLFILNIPL